MSLLCAEDFSYLPTEEVLKVIAVVQGMLLNRVVEWVLEMPASVLSHMLRLFYSLQGRLVQLTE